MAIDLADLPPFPNQTSNPTSPTAAFSGGWNMNKSNSELTMLLKEAYNVIKDKERDLTLAAEIGKSLLENNIALKSKYEALVEQLKDLQRKQHKATTFTLQANQLLPITPVADSITEENQSYDYSDSDEETAISSSVDYGTGAAELTSRRAAGGRRFIASMKDFENIKELERINVELQATLENVMNEGQEKEKGHKVSIRRLESNMDALSAALEAAQQKIEDLERENERLIKKQKSDFWNLKYNKKNDDSDDIIEKLLQKVAELEDQNAHVERAKAEIEARLQRAVNELDVLNEQYDLLEDTSKEYIHLQEQYDKQARHIDELNQTLEEHRSMIVSMSQNNPGTPSRSSSEICAQNQSSRRLSEPDGMRSLFTSPGGGSRRTLLSELENEWFRDLQLFQRNTKRRVESPPFSPVMSQADLRNFFNSSQVDNDDPYESEDEYSFLGEFEEDEDDLLRRREWFYKRWGRAIWRFLRAVWRWFRFLVILCAAVLMALWRGPDDVLPSEM